MVHDDPIARSEDEVERLRSLRRHNILDTAPEQEFDDLVALASDICHTPIGGITMLDAERQWFKAKIGLDVAETHRSLAFCHHTIQGSDIYEVEDSLKSELFCKNDLVLAGPKLRFYAGVPLRSIEGYKVGSLWVGDRVPRKLKESQRENLKRLAHQAEALLRLKYYLAELHAVIQSRDNMVSRLQALERTMEN
ncbi:MAG TPA: GAF domain-containing protein [Terriglobales bacterium]|nr:GAF domain-containing protein [Terriglobales bacterium]